MGAVADFIYRNAVYPIPEVAVAGAIALMAGICGRAYNVSKTGLNQYVILVARTGAGKDAAGSGIDALLLHMRTSMPAITALKGPGVLSSGQALLKVLDKKNCFFSLLNEFGLTLASISKPTATSAEVMLRRVLLQVYTMSGHGRILDEVAYSDRDKNTNIVVSPSVTLLGDTTPEKYFGAMDSGVVEEGLIPRFLHIESDYEGGERNEEAGIAPSEELVRQLSDMALSALTVMQNNNVCHVAIDGAAKELLKAFERQCNAHRRGDHVRASDKELWSRAYLKTVKLAGLVAVGCDWHRPTIDAACAQWAIDVVVRGTNAVVDRFDKGDVGGGEVQFESELRKAVERYLEMRPAQRINAKCPADCVKHNVIPFAYLRTALRRRSCFQNARMGVVRAVDVAIQDAVNAGILVEIPKTQALTLGILSRCWVVGSA